MTISPASRNGRRRADWDWRNGESAPPHLPMPAAPRRRARPIRRPRLSSSANAGSGKTHVLVQRVIRLLLNGVPPEKILCITFTKAAAANMAERVFTTLGHWVTLDDDALDAAIRDAGIARPDRETADNGAQIVRLRAGNAGRSEGADHPRAVHAAAAAIPVRGQCAGAFHRARRARPDRDDGARQSGGAAGSLAQSRQCHRAGAATAMASAADVTFRDVVREACLSRDHVHGLDRSRRRRGRRGRRDVRSARCRRRAIASKISSARSSMGRNLPRSRNGRRSRLGCSRPAANPIRIRRRGCARRWRQPEARRSIAISTYS